MTYLIIHDIGYLMYKIIMLNVLDMITLNNKSYVEII